MNKVGIGFIGTGFARKIQMPAFAACESAKIISIASGSPDNASAAAEEFHAPHSTADWRETVTHPDVDLVCITTPPSMHQEMTMFAVSQGKHILCEKPMAMTAVEAEEMTKAAAEKGILAIIDHELRFLPGRIAVKQMLLEGAVGKVRHAKTTFRAPHRGDPNSPFNWWSEIKYGGGALGAINSHIIDSLYWFLGTSISSVTCQLHTNIKERPDAEGIRRTVTSDDEANMLLRFSDGDTTSDATGIVSVSMVEGPDYLHRMEFYGEDGVIRVEYDGSAFIAKRGEADWSPIKTDRSSPIPGVSDTGFAGAFWSFAPVIVNAIREGKHTVDGAATFEDGLRVQLVLDAARLSDAEGRTVRLN